MSGAGSGEGEGAAGTRVVFESAKVTLHAPGDELDLSECLHEIREAIGTRYIHPDTIDECFDEFDTDSSGSIDKTELGKASMRLIDLQCPGASKLVDSRVLDKVITDTLELLDTNEDGKVDKKEFVELFTHSKGLDLVLDTDEPTESESKALEHMRKAIKGGTISRKAVDEVFIGFDTNKSGAIERRELAKMTMRLLELQYPDALDAIDEEMVDQALDDTMSKLDFDKDGVLNKKEFEGIFTHRDGLHLKLVD